MPSQASMIQVIQVIHPIFPFAYFKDPSPSLIDRASRTDHHQPHRPRQPIGSRAWVGTEYVCFGQRLGMNLDVDPNPSLIGQSRPAPPLGGSQGISHSSRRWETRGASCKNFWSSDSGSRVDVLDTPVALCR
jgi:hypothetical protein